MEFTQEKLNWKYFLLSSDIISRLGWVTWALWYFSSTLFFDTFLMNVYIFCMGDSYTLLYTP